MPIRFGRISRVRESESASPRRAVLAASPSGLPGPNNGVRIDDGCSSDRRGARLLRRLLCLYARLRQAVREGAMLFDYVFGGAVTAFLALYLTYALVRPERF